MDPITLTALAAAAIAGGLAGWRIGRGTGTSTGTLSPDGSWTPPDPPGTSDPPLVTADPRIAPSGVALGVGLPCPGNPPPPVGWAYWTAGVTPAMSAWAVQMRDANPIGSFIQAWIDGQLVGARIEYHSLQGATGATGCFKGLNLLTRIG